MTTTSTISTSSFMQKLHPLGLNEPAPKSQAPKGDGVDEGNGFLGHHPYLSAAATGAAIVGVPVYLLTRNIAATAIAGAAGAVAGMGVRFLYDISNSLDSAF